MVHKHLGPGSMTNRTLGGGKFQMTNLIFQRVKHLSSAFLAQFARIICLCIITVSDAISLVRSSLARETMHFGVPSTLNSERVNVCQQKNSDRFTVLLCEDGLIVKEEKLGVCHKLQPPSSSSSSVFMNILLTIPAYISSFTVPHR